MTTKPLLDYFETFLPLTAEEKSVVERVIIPKKVRRRQYILQEGDICRHNTFVVEGCFRMFTVDEKGKNIISSLPLNNGG